CPHAGRPGTLTVRAVFSYTRRSRSPPNVRYETTVPTGAASSHSWAPSGSLSVSPAFHGKVASSAAHSACTLAHSSPPLSAAVTTDRKSTRLNSSHVTT